MRPCFRALFISLLPALAGLSCAPRDHADTEIQRTASLKSFQAVTYRRAGGTTGVNDLFTISDTGQLQANSALFGKAQGHLTEFQILQIGRLFEGFENLNAEYPSPRPAARPAIVEIQRGDKTVRLADDAEKAPDNLLLIRDKLQTLMQQTLGRPR
jgi:hypothetical protein